MRANKQRVVAIHPTAYALKACGGWEIAQATVGMRAASRGSKTPRQAWEKAAKVIPGRACTLPIYTKPRHTHKHKCYGCGTIWEHVDDCGGDQEAHTCACGLLVWEKYHGNESPLGPARLCIAPKDEELRPPKGNVDLFSLLDQLFSR